MKSLLSLVPALFGLVVLAACAEDLTAVNASYVTASDGWNKTLADARKAGDDLALKVQGLPPVADGDATGKGLKTKLDASVAAHKQAIADLEQVSVETKAAVEKAQAEQKVKPVQDAVDAGNAKWTSLSPRLAETATAAGAAVDALKAHLDAEAAKAAAAANDPAAKDPVTVTTAGGEASFVLVYNDKNEVDEAASAAPIARMTKFMGTCDGLRVELTGTGPDDKAGKARADAAQKFLEGKGLPKTKIMKTSGATGDGVLVTKVTSACPMNPGAAPDTDRDGAGGEATR